MGVSIAPFFFCGKLLIADGMEGGPKVFRLTFDLLGNLRLVPVGWALTSRVRCSVMLQSVIGSRKEPMSQKRDMGHPAWWRGEEIIDLDLGLKHGFLRGVRPR